MANPFSTLETLVRNLVQSVNALVQAVTNATPGVPSPTLGAAGDYLNVNGSTTGYQFRTPSEVRGDIGAAASGANSDITSLSGLTTPL
ncbi:hypothetical protein, partial [Acidiphilium sp.]|uniref:hypothetical protein n=1 Tax=Acidiphilium sp. TaxID=527 RepID=UPI002C430499